MGLWHQRKINNQGLLGNIGKSDFSFSFDATLNLEQDGKLALFSSPYTSNSMHPQYLNSKNSIFLAIDGEIHDCNSISNRVVNAFDYVINLYKSYGYEGLYQLDGAFSLVLYDTKDQTTLLYRSFLTGYPLYFVAKNNFLTVSTNPVYLLHRSDVSDDLNEKKMSAIFSLSFSEWNNSVFSDLTELDHGEMVIITPKGIEHRERRLDEIFKKEQYSSEAESIDKYRYLVEKSVKESLLPDVEHGIMLSSGMDSSTIAVFASKILHQQNRELTAYSWTLPNDPLGDESENIKELCKMLKIPLKIFNGECFGPFDALENLLLLPDTPYTNPFWPISAEIYRRASIDGIGLLLNGNYADTQFKGSSKLLIDILKDSRYQLFFSTVKMILKQSGYRNSLKQSPAIRGFLRHFLPIQNIKKRVFQAPEWLSDDAKENSKLMFLERMENSGIEKGFEHFSTALSPFQAGSLGMDRYLSGNYGIQRIEPHRNIELLNYSLGFSTYMTYRNGQTKYFAREAMRGLLPESIRTQPRVGDLNHFIQNSYARNKKKVREMLLDDHSSWKQYVDELWMENKLKSSGTLSYADFLVIWVSLNMQQWGKAIKPGGSLYEGHFAKKSHDKRIK